MPGVHDAIVGVLEPYMSFALASTFVRATAVSLHKDPDSLCAEDYGALEDGLRSMLSPVASSALVEQTLGDVRAKLQEAS